ncbi:MAG: nicotinate (nicotinamide) nucleotide adenylyltransferase [Chthoniobacterales bacterium]|nr:nicotinate (nicotinamide) nucleotide adenylyltransferase [Chthoniobacterales bacterium]
MNRIGIYGGTFDPIHHAHLILAREALEKLGLDEVVFVPAAISPHKLEHVPAPGAARVEMLAAAIADEARFRLDELELHRPPPSFTIDTVEAFRQSKPGAEMYYLIGSDNLPRVHTWRRFDDLQRLVRFVVLTRGREIPPCDYLLIQRQVDISATDIRNRVATGRSIRYLVPSAVQQVIRRQQLYKEPTR